MKKVGLFIGIYLVLLVALVFIVYVGNRVEQKDALNEAGEGLFNLAANDISIIYEYNGKPYMQFIDGNKYIKIAVKKYNAATDEEERLKWAREINRINELNTQARGQGVLIVLLSSLALSVVAFKISSSFIFKKSEAVKESQNIHTNIHIDALKDSNSLARKKAAMILGNRGDKEAMDPLREVAESDVDNEVREAAKIALEKLQRL